jgi:hypothetical protein
VLSDREWRELKPPTLFLVGEHEKLYDAGQALARLRRVAPQVRTGLIPEAGHDLTMVQAELINNKVLDFLRSVKIPAAVNGVPKFIFKNKKPVSPPKVGTQVLFCRPKLQGENRFQPCHKILIKSRISTTMIMGLTMRLAFVMTIPEPK